MRHITLALSLIATAAILVGCGGGSSGGPQVNKVKFSSQISFGDSLSDVGTYKVGTVAALRGGQFTINGAVDNVFTGKNWTELMGAQLGVSVCPAQTGLGGDAAQGFNVPVVNHPECTGYGQGGSRIFDANGIGHTGPTGALTVPVATQIQNHLTLNNGAFKGDAVVFMLAGANDLFTQVGILGAGATAAGQAEGARVGAQTFASNLVQSLAAGATNPATAAQAIGTALATENARAGHTDQSVVGAAVGAAAIQPGNAAVANPAVYGPMVTAAQAAAAAAGKTAGEAAGAAYVTTNAPLAVAEMGRLGAELGNLAKNQVVAKGANYVVVVNIPVVELTPDSLEPTVTDAQRALISQMVNTFNTQLRSSVAAESKILYVDAYSANRDNILFPALHGLSNVTKRACDLNPAKNPLMSSLACNTGNLISDPDPGHFLFADGVHPTPYGHLLLARFVSKEMIAKGWL